MKLIAGSICDKKKQSNIFFVCASGKAQSWKYWHLISVNSIADITFSSLFDISRRRTLKTNEILESWDKTKQYTHFRKKEFENRLQKSDFSVIWVWVKY